MPRAERNAPCPWSIFLNHPPRFQAPPLHEPKPLLQVAPPRPPQCPRLPASLSLPDLPTPDCPVVPPHSQSRQPCFSWLDESIQAWSFLRQTPPSIVGSLQEVVLGLSHPVGPQPESMTPPTPQWCFTDAGQDPPPLLPPPLPPPSPLFHLPPPPSFIFPSSLSSLLPPSSSPSSLSSLLHLPPPPSPFLPLLPSLPLLIPKH